MKSFFLKCSWFLAFTATAMAADEIAISPAPTPKILFLGNSITLHSPAPEIGWTGNWGMAATSEDKDYVHLILNGMTAVGSGKPRSMVKNIAAFEREYPTFDIEEKLRQELEFGATLVVIAIGENVSEPASEEAKKALEQAVTKLLMAFKQHGEPKIFVRSCFWPSPAKDAILRKCSEAAGAKFVDISALGKDPTNQARAERKIEHAGVAGHPGDKGMKEIADALLKAIQETSIPKPK